MRINKKDIIVLPEVLKICESFEMDPYSSISEGTLLITCRPEKAQEVVDKLKKNKIESSICGDVVEKSKGITVIDNGKETELKHPRIDPFWSAFAREMGAKG
jgi:hydrogenase expression/formation protein HypE